MNGEPEIERQNDMAKQTKDATAAGAAGTEGVTGDFQAPVAAPAKTLDLVPESQGRNTPQAIAVLMQACDRFGVNPTTTCRPMELKAWRFEPGDRLDGRPDAVVILTQAGLKIRHYADPTYLAPGATEAAMDQDTEERLRTQVFHAFQQDPKTKEVTPVQLPADLTLPASFVDGRVRSTGHRYPGGYLRRQAAAK